MKRRVILNFTILLIMPTLAIAAKHSEQGKYVPDEIIVKLRATVSNIAEEQPQLKHSHLTLKLSKRLDELNEKHWVKRIEPLFKSFKQKRLQIENLLKKDRSLLTKKEQHILPRVVDSPLYIFEPFSKR